MTRPRVVLDTSVLISGLPGGSSVPVLKRWRRGEFELVISPEIYAETEVIVPPAVYEEVVTQGAGRSGASAVAEAHWLCVLAPATPATIEPLQFQS